MKPRQKGLKSVNAKMMMSVSIVDVVPGDGHYHWLRGLINPLPMEHRAEYLAYTTRRILDFVIYPLS